MVPLFAHLSAERAQTYSLVLASVGIPHTMHRRGRRWSITVARHERGPAQQAVSLYLLENPLHQDHPGAPAPPHPRSWSAIYVSLLLATIHIAISATGQQNVFITTYGADAHLILNGQAFRCITALLLHSDWAHLVGNMAGTVLFGTFAARLYGLGICWLLIVAAGGLGNAGTAWWYGGDHLSIGASTGVFAALGLCSATAFRQYRRHHSRRLRPWISMAGALALLGWLGASPRSDLLAHMLGLLCGCGIGILWVKWMDRASGRTLQAVGFATTTAVVFGSCLWGFFI
jgi:membrane associated rhomboid family serine protease